MNSEIKMSVSSVTRTKDSKAVYVMFTDGGKTVEFSLPGCTVVRNNGFTDEDVDQLRNYVNNEQDSIFEMAKTVNPIKALMKDN